MTLFLQEPSLARLAHVSGRLKHELGQVRPMEGLFLLGINAGSAADSAARKKESSSRSPARLRTITSYILLLGVELESRSQSLVSSLILLCLRFV
jgi:hypothetical protein